MSGNFGNLIFADDILSRTPCQVYTIEECRNDDRSLSSDVDALANLSCSCGAVSPNNCSNETEDTADATTFEEDESVIDKVLNDYDDASILSEYDSESYPDFLQFYPSSDGCDYDPYQGGVDCQFLSYSNDRQNYLVKRLQDKFRERKKRLKRLRTQVGKTSSLAKFLKRNEKLTESVCIERIFDNSTNGPRAMSYISEVIRRLEFEVHFSLPGLLSLLPYCACHVCLYDIFVLTLAEIDVDSIYGIPTSYWLVVVGFIVLRLSGSIWYWLDENRYEAARFAFHNKAIMHDIDSATQKWFEEHENFHIFFQVLGFFTVYAGLYNILRNTFFIAVCDMEEEIFENLPSTIDETESFVKLLFMERGAAHKHLDMAYVNSTGVCEDLSGRYWYDYEYVSNIIAKSSYFEYLGYEWTPLYTYKCAISAQVGLGLFSYACLRLMGLNFWR